MTKKGPNWVLFLFSKTRAATSYIVGAVVVSLLDLMAGGLLGSIITATVDAIILLLIISIIKKA